MKHFSTPTFKGERFRSHSLPLDVAQDLGAYERLILDLAKQLYLESNPQRQRVPNGFGKDFHLHIEKINEGSSKPVLSLLGAGMFAVSTEYPYLMQAQEIVEECLAQEELPEKFPKHLLRYFNQLGKSLKEGESMGFEHNGVLVELTPEKRKRLMLALDKRYSKDIEITGYVNAPHFEKNPHFHLITEDYGTVYCPMEGMLLRAIRDKKMAGFSRNLLTLEVSASFDEKDQLRDILKVASHEIQENAQIVNRIETLYDLEEGWAGAGSKAFDEHHLGQVAHKLASTFPPDLPLPFIAPTPDGDLLLEWEEYNDLSADIELATGDAYLHAFSDTSTADIEHEVNFLTETERFYALIEEVIA